MAGNAGAQRSAYAYISLAERIRSEWKIYIIALVFAVIASAIGQIAVPVGPGQLILFPIFYSLILGILSGPSVAKIFKKPEVKAASKLVIVGICPFIAKLGINAGVGAGIMMAAAAGSLSVIYPGQADQITALASASQTIAGIDGVYLAMFVALPFTGWLYRKLEPRFAAWRREPSAALKAIVACGSIVIALVKLAQLLFA